MPVSSPSPELIERFVAAGVWQEQPLHALVDARAASRPDAPAVADQHERLTYAEFVRRTHAVARFLLDSGLEPGATVSVQSGNRLALAVAHLACSRADLVFVPLSTAWGTKETEHLLALSQADVVIVPRPSGGTDHLDVVSRLRDRLPALRLVGSLDGPAVGADFDFDEVSRRAVGPVVSHRSPNAPRFVMVTSGTTAYPKMSLWSDNNLWALVQEYTRAVQLTADDVAVGLSPAGTGAVGYVYPVLAPLLAGASSVLLEKWSVDNALELIEVEGATTATAVPTQVIKMLQSDGLGDRDVSRLRAFTNAGAPLPPHVAAELEDVFGCFGHVAYGSTDGGSPFMTAVRDSVEHRRTTVGRLSPLSEVRLVDADGTEVGPGEVGEIQWRTPTKSYGYLNDPERTAAAWTDDGYYRSGDLGSLDADGYLRIVGRAKDLIIRGGQNISPLEVEIEILRHPAVADVSVVGLPDPVYGERTCACVVTRPGRSVTLAELVDLLVSQGLATYKLPERLELFDDLPKGAGGKIRKVDLRELVAEREPVPH